MATYVQEVVVLLEAFKLNCFVMHEILKTLGHLSHPQRVKYVAKA